MEQTLLSRYRLIEEIGKGGMAVVYRGEDTSLDREVAIKVLHSFLADKEESRRRFQREARVVAKLRHDNILEIFDYSGLDSDESFIVTEFIHGDNLSNFLENHEIRVPEIAALIVLEIAKALHHAHEAAIIHRDIKPENIMIRKDGVLKLMDFGIAQIIDTQKLTMTGQLLGSPAYMAPEMILGGGIDFRTDIFSLGVMLYRLATGELPFVGKNPHEVLKKIAEADHTPPSVVNPSISQSLEDIIERSLELEKDARYSSVKEMVIDLENLLHSIGIEEPEVQARAFFLDPEAFDEKLRVRMVDQLLDEATDLSKMGRFPAALRKLNRVLALDENNPRVPELLKGLKRRENIRHFLKTGGLAILIIFVITGVVWGFVGLMQSETMTLGEHLEHTAEQTTPGVAESPDEEEPPVVLADHGKDLETEDKADDRVNVEKEQHATPLDDSVGEKSARNSVRDRKKPIRKSSGPQLETKEEKVALARKFTLMPFPAAVRVRLNGKDLGDYGRKLRTLELGPGDHKITLESPHCYDKHVYISASDEGKVLRPRLKWRHAVLRISSNVPADIEADGRGVGKTNSPFGSMIRIPPNSTDGKVKVLVKVSAPDYDTWQDRLELEAGVTRTLRVDLKKSR